MLLRELEIPNPMKPRILACLSAIFSFLWCFYSDAQTLRPVSVGIAGLNNNTIHSFVSRDVGLFRKYGVDPKLIVFQAGSLLAQASMAGEVKISMVSGPVTLAARSAGSDSVIVAALINTLPYKMIVAKGISRSEQLRGKKIGISRFGSSTDTAVRLFLAKFSLVPDRDVTIVQAGEQASRFAALAAGTIDATIVGVPLDVTARRQGYPILADLAQLQLPYPQAIMETTDRMIRDEPQLIKNYLKGLIEGIHYGVNNPEKTKAILNKYVNIKTPEFLEATYQDYVHITDLRAYPNLEGIRFALEEVAKRAPAARGRKPEEFVNLRFLQELEKEGFYKQLYGG
jgi:NitT/TauT family transport system substrate-binding protein